MLNKNLRAGFDGTLNRNLIQSMLFNMIIAQQTFADNIAGADEDLVSQGRVEGSLFGDTKLYYSIDILGSYNWLADEEARNLLKLHRPNAPKVQKIVIDTYRQIALTMDNYLSKQPWSSETYFNEWASVQMQQIGETKRVHESSIYNTYIGTHRGNADRSLIEVELPVAGASATAVEKEATNRLRGGEIAVTIANEIVGLTHLSRKYNDYGYMRSYSKERIKVIWNSKYVNEIKYVDIPSVFNNQALKEKLDSEVLPDHYFGVIGTQDKVSTGAEISLVEEDFTDGTDTYHVFPGEEIPTGCQIKANEYYTIDKNVICKILVVLPPMMVAFSVGTSFFNSRSLTETHFLTFGYSKPQYLENYPYLEVREKTNFGMKTTVNQKDLLANKGRIKK